MRALTLLLTLLCGNAIAAIAFDTSGVFNDAAVQNATNSYTCSSGADVIIIISVSIFEDTPAGTVDTVTYNAAGLTEVESQVLYFESTQATQLFYLLGPATGANDIVVSTSKTHTNIDTAVVCYTGVRGVGSSVATGRETAVMTHSDDVTGTAAGSLIVDFFDFFNGSETVGSGQTQKINSNGGTSFESQSSSEELSTGGTVTMSWTTSANEESGHMALELLLAGTAAIRHRGR